MNTLQQQAKQATFILDDLAEVKRRGNVGSQPRLHAAIYHNEETNRWYRVFDMGYYFRVLSSLGGERLYHQHQDCTFRADIAHALSLAMGYKVLQKHVEFTRELGCRYEGESHIDYICKGAYGHCSI